MVGKESGASDVHLAVSSRPSWRRFGVLEPIWLKAPVLTAADTERLATSFLTDAQWQALAERGDVDFAYPNSFGRFRASIVKQRLGYDLTFRIINSRVKTMDELGLPPQLKLLTQYHNGLVLVTGSVGSGKSTTLAALVEEVNLTRRDHIITLEDPIEYIIPSKNCHVTQREVHTHTTSFGAALRGALREDPDVIMVGEMRDLGDHLPRHHRFRNRPPRARHSSYEQRRPNPRPRARRFPNDQREQIRIMVSESLRGIISQQLIPRADNTGRCLAMEILMNNPAVGNLIREGKTFMLPGVIQTGKKQGMILMDDSLLQLCEAGLISVEEAMYRAENKTTDETSTSD